MMSMILKMRKALNQTMWRKNNTPTSWSKAGRPFGRPFRLEEKAWVENQDTQNMPRA